MPRIDPLQLLNCLQILLGPSGGILSKDEVQRLASLMTKFSKKLVSKCVYVLILKNTERTLLGEFMAAGGWTLIQLWLHDAMYSMNWALVQELLILLLITPVDVERLKSNNIPKLVKSLSKREDLQAVHELSNQLVQQWLKIVKDETQSELSSQKHQAQNVAQPTPDVVQEQMETVEVSPEEVVDDEGASTKDDVEIVDTHTVYKYSLKDGKHLISKVGSNEPNVELVENVEVVQMKDDEEVKDKEKSKEKKKAHDKSRHKSSSSSSKNSSRDKDKSRSHKDKIRHSSSSSKDRDKSKDKDKHRNNGALKISKSSSNKDKEKDKKDVKEKQAEKDKDTLSKIQPQTIQKLPKIPKKVDDKDKNKDAKKNEIKKGTMSIEVRKTNEERPKTVKVYKAKMRSTGLEEEAKPAPPRPVKKPGTTVPVIPPPPLPSLSLKRPSPTRDLGAIPPEKKSKIETPLERPGSIKLIPPKPKPPVLQESDMFMDALTASASTKKEPKKRKRRASVSKDSSGTSPPNSPVTPANGSLPPPAGLKNITPPMFYQDTLETAETKSADGEAQNNNETVVHADAVDVDTKTVTVEPDVVINVKPDEPVSNNSGGLKSVLSSGKRPGPKKSIKWKPDDELVEIQYFELDETERVNVSKAFIDMAKMDVRGEREAIQMSRKLQNEDVMDVQMMWKIPMEIDCPKSLAIPGCKSLEKDIQFAREKSVLQDVYFKHLLPDTPAEPDPENYQIKDPITIPIEDIENPDHDFRNTPWPDPKGSPPPPALNEPTNPVANFPNVQMPYQNVNVPIPQPNFQNMQQFPGAHFIPQNNVPPGGGDWNNMVPPNMHNHQLMPRNMPPNMPPPEMMNQNPMNNPNMYMPPPENFNHMMNDNGHRFPPPHFNQQGPAMFPLNNFNRGGHGYGPPGNHGGGFRRGGGGNGPWLRMNGPSPGGWNNRGGGGPHRGSGRLCNNYRNKGFCKNRENCLFFHPNS